MRKAISTQLVDYANRFETAAFLQGDPSWFMHQVKGTRNQETMAFVASCMSYGSRKQFLPKIQWMLDTSRGEIYEWIGSGAFAEVLADDGRCFYRLYTNHTVYVFLQGLREMFAVYGSLGEFVKTVVEPEKGGKRDALKVLQALSDYFYDLGLTGIVPRPVTSLCKRPCMFLRWMVRDDSPVDLGIWADSIDKATLFIPMDTHVMQTAKRLGLITTKTASWRTTIDLSRKMAKVFPGDPARGDFALYGADVLDANPHFSK